MTRRWPCIAVAALCSLLAVATPADAGSGWLLLYPPFVAGLPRVFDDRAPLALWASGDGDTYATKRLCQIERLGRLSLLEHMNDEHSRAPVPLSPAAEQMFREEQAFLIRFHSAAQCLPSDDPRLAAAPPQRDDRSILRYTPGRPIIAVVRLNGGRSTARLLLDTGADGSMVKPELLAAAGVDLSRPAARGEASGITGKIQVSYFTVDFEVAGHRARVTHVAAFNRYDDDFADWLLGRDFLDRFKVLMDPAAGTVTLVPR